MPWLKQDDGMAEHPKTKRLVRRRKHIGLAAFGLHHLAMLNAARYLTDGHVPTEFVEDWADRAGLRAKDLDTLTDALVTSGQWTIHETDGWWIHDYLDHNPSRAQVEAQRAHDADRKRRGRDKQKNQPSVSQDPGPEPDTPWCPEGVQPDTGRTSGGVRPSRPDPSHTRPSEEEDAREPVTVTHPALPNVLGVLHSLPDVLVEPLSVEHVLAAHPWADDQTLIAAAHDVGAWLTSSSPPKSRDAGTLLRAQLRREVQAREARREGQKHAIRQATSKRAAYPEEADDARRLERMAAAMTTTTNEAA